MSRTHVNTKDLIKEFLGKDHYLCRGLAAPEFESSWYWIMPVYHACVKSLDCKERDAILDDYFPIGVFMNPLDLHNSCVAFIKYYNLTFKKEAA